jgi:hypothetical protein
MPTGSSLDEPRTLINQHKRLDVFRCIHDAHHRFGSRVSVWHVLKARQCYPGGCVYFRWHCAKLERNLPCPRSFTYVGRLCHGCTHFLDEKMSNHLEQLLDEKEERRFRRDLEEYEFWLERHRGREVTFYGEVFSVKPKVVRTMHPSGGVENRLDGFLVSFLEGYIGYTHFQDPIYLALDLVGQRKARLAPGDTFQCQARLTTDRGRLVLRRPRGFDFDQRSGAPVISEAEARVAVRTANWFRLQPEKCLACPHGILADVRDRRGASEKHYRRMACLEGVEAPLECVVAELSAIANEVCLEQLEAGRPPGGPGKRGGNNRSW